MTGYPSIIGLGKSCRRSVHNGSKPYNPMDLGFLLILLGWAAFLSNVLTLVLLPAFILYMNRFQISPEERVLLASLFAHDYAEYRARVRRWL